MSPPLAFGGLRRGDDNTLFDLMSGKRWDEAMSRTNTEEGREELGRKGEDGMLPLHYACNYGAPLELVEAMLGGYKEAVRRKKKRGRIPLHIACRPASGDVSPRLVRLLLDAYPEGAKTANQYRALPLHVAASNKNAPTEVLEMLLEAHPEGVAAVNYIGQFPLHFLAERASPDEKEDMEKVELLFRPLLDNEGACLLGGGWSNVTPLDIGARFDLLRLLECMRIPRCPAEVVVDVTRRHPGQLRERDDNGSLPLHLAAANPNLNWKRFQHECLVDTLVNVYPEEAATSNGEGRFPLSLAIESGKRWDKGVEAIANAAKGVMTIRDVGTNLFPFMLAASRADPCVTTVYKLLRSCPDLCKKP